MVLGRQKGFRFSPEEKARIWSGEWRRAQAERMRKLWVKQREEKGKGETQ